MFSELAGCMFVHTTRGSVNHASAFVRETEHACVRVKSTVLVIITVCVILMS